MKELAEYYDIPVEQRRVDIIRILKDGQVIISKKEFEEVEEKFSWVNRQELVNTILELRSQTDSNRKSIIAIFETREIKTFPNISKNFTKFNLLNKSGL